MNRDLGERTASLLLLLLVTLVLAGCAVGPNYKRPTVDVPVTYRGNAAEPVPSTEPSASEPAKAPTANAAPESLGDEKWWEVFQDKELQELIRTALQNNYDVRIAAARVLEAQAQLGITRADQLPTLGVGGGVTSQQSPKQGQCCGWVFPASAARSAARDFSAHTDLTPGLAAIDPNP